MMQPAVSTDETQFGESPEKSIDLAKFLNTSYGVIGRTVSTKNEPNTSSEFHFWVANLDEVQGKIEIGNLVSAFSDDGNDITFGVVTEMRAYSDIDSFIADYLSHNFGEATVEVPTDVSEVIVVTCAVMRNISSKTKPVGRSRVYFPSELGIRFSYGIVNESGQNIFSGAAIPIGIFENGDGTVAPISVDEHFLIGPEGAHLNVSGISGLASKTSALQFIIKSLLVHTEKRIAVVMFNVKHKDLVYIDQPNPKCEEDSWSIKAYEVLGIPAKPFIGARFFAPADPSNNPDGTKSLRMLKTTRFEWDLQMFYRDIPSLFSSFDWDDKMENAWFVLREEIENPNHPILTYAELVNWLNRLIRDAGRNEWPRSVHIATWRKMLSHLQRFPSSYQGLITSAGQGRDIPWKELKSHPIYVVDIQMLSDQGKRLVFGRAIREISNMLEAGDSGLDAVVVFVDELNKFAPSGNIQSPLKSRLIDITARGRSIGLVLFGAEQFASSVEKEIIENSSTYLFGRTETNELRTPNYSAFSDEIKTKLTMLPQGHLLVKFAKFPQPIFVRFPYPPCTAGDQWDGSISPSGDG